MLSACKNHQGFADLRQTLRKNAERTLKTAEAARGKRKYALHFLKMNNVQIFSC